MRKIPTLFVRDWGGDRSRVTREVNPECSWVLDGEGVPTRKWDGTAVLVEGGRAFKRYELRPGKAAPPGFRPAQDVDPETGKQPGWVPTDPEKPEDAWLYEALRASDEPPGDGTYELLGPKVQGNPDGVASHILERHGAAKMDDRPIGRDYDNIRTYLEANPMEGLVWHHPDGRMAKIKRRDFGLPWPARAG